MKLVEDPWSGLGNVDADNLAPHSFPKLARHVARSTSDVQNRVLRLNARRLKQRSCDLGKRAFLDGINGQPFARCFAVPKI